MTKKGGKSRGAARKPVPVKHAQFKISASLFEELGERLVSKPEVALAELIKNSYDADALTCRLTLSPTQIVIEDDGHGMTERNFLDNWMVVSSPTKGSGRFSRIYGRSMAGSKGVGRFSARFLANVVDLVSTAKDERTGKTTRLAATFDWDLISRKVTVADVSIDYTVTAMPEGTPHGTTLTLRSLREDVAKISGPTVKSDVLKLADPAAGLEKPPFRKAGHSAGLPRVVDPGFSVVFPGTTEEHGSDTVGESVAKTILDSYVGRVRLLLDEQGTLQYEVFWRGHKDPVDKKKVSLARLARPFSAEQLAKELGPRDERDLPITLADVQHLPLATALHSPVFIDLRFFPRRAGTYANLPLNGKRAQAWISERSGVPIVDNGFAMASYADPNSDWLGIDASKATNEREWQSILTSSLYPMDEQDKRDPQRNPMLALPRGKQVIGRIHIATSKLPRDRVDEGDAWLQPNMDRESLRSNSAYRLLWHLARFGMELLAVHDRNERLTEKIQQEKQGREEAQTALSSAIREIQQADDIAPEFKHRIAERLRSVEAHISSAAENARETQLSLELMSMMGVMAGFMTHEFEKAMLTLTDAAEGARILANKSPEMAAAAQKIIDTEERLLGYLNYMRLFIGRARDPSPTAFKARAQINYALKAMQATADSHKVVIEVDVEKSLPGPLVPLAAYHGIIINLVSNALKALVAKISTAPREIRIYATNVGERHILTVADNGIGIPDYIRDRVWDALFTTTSDEEENSLGTGMGLGLSVVKRVAEHVGGKAELMAQPPQGYITAFRVSLPLSLD